MSEKLTPLWTASYGRVDHLGDDRPVGLLAPPRRSTGELAGEHRVDDDLLAFGGHLQFDELGGEGLDELGVEQRAEGRHPDDGADLPGGRGGRGGHARVPGRQRRQGDRGDGHHRDAEADAGQQQREHQGQVGDRVAAEGQVGEAARPRPRSKHPTATGMRGPDSATHLPAMAEAMIMPSAMGTNSAAVR